MVINFILIRKNIIYNFQAEYCLHRLQCIIDLKALQNKLHSTDKKKRNQA